MIYAYPLFINNKTAVNAAIVAWRLAFSKRLRSSGIRHTYIVIRLPRPPLSVRLPRIHGRFSPAARAPGCWTPIRPRPGSTCSDKDGTTDRDPRSGSPSSWSVATAAAAPTSWPSPSSSRRRYCRPWPGVTRTILLHRDTVSRLRNARPALFALRASTCTHGRGATVGARVTLHNTDGRSAVDYRRACSTLHRFPVRRNRRKNNTVRARSVRAPADGRRIFTDITLYYYSCTVDDGRAHTLTHTIRTLRYCTHEMTLSHTDDY